MQVYTKVSEIQDILTAEREKGKSIGFVPTMGALHEGHLSLIRQCRDENEISVCSIFINPTQFNDKGDYNRYPRMTDNDLGMLESVGCHYVFLPTEEEIYPSESFKTILFSVGPLGEIMEGRYRAGHFAGVAAVVKRFFDIVMPDRAYFGQKDYQQCLVIEKLINDFQLSIELIFCPTVRDADGLAMSSRNMLLREGEREQAALIFRVLSHTRQRILEGHLSMQEIRREALGEFSANGNFAVDYFDICSAKDLLPVQDYERSKSLIICVAAYLGKVRLIDNLIV